MSIDSNRITAEAQLAICRAATLALQNVDLGTPPDVVEEIVAAARNCFNSALVALLRARNARTVACSSMPHELWTLTWSLLPMKDRFSASRVCHSWRAIALSAATLWTHIDMPCKIKDIPGDIFWECSSCLQQDGKIRQYSGSFRSLEPMLLRSGALPVCVRVSNRYRGTHIGYVEHLAGLLHTHAARIKELHVSSVTCEEFVPELLNGLSSLPSLRRLSAICTHGDDDPETLNLREALAHSHIEDLDLSAGFEWDAKSLGDDLSLPHLRRLSLAVYDPSQLSAVLRACPGLISLSIDPYSSTSVADWDLLTIAHLTSIPSLHIKNLPTAYEEWLALFQHAPKTHLSVTYASEALPTPAAFLVLKSFTAPVHILCSTTVDDSDEEWLVMEFQDSSRTLTYEWPYDADLDQIKWNALPEASIVSLDLELSLWQDLVFDLHETASIQSVTLSIMSLDHLDETFSLGSRLRFPSVKDFRLHGLLPGIVLAASDIVLMMETLGVARFRRLQIEKLQLHGGVQSLTNLADEVRYLSI